MSRKIVKEVDSIYSGGSTKRNRIFDDISCSSNFTAGWWPSILGCCWKRNQEKKGNLKEFNPNEWDYIVEKLVVKRVPLALYATEEDFQEFMEEKNYKDSTPYNPFAKEMRDKQVYSAMPDMGSNFYFFKTKGRGNLSNRPSSKNLRFNREEDLLDEDAMQAGPSNYHRVIPNLRIKEDEAMNEYLNQFSSFHPDLKENERPPKDPSSLNPPRNKRSLAENISEIAASTGKTFTVKPRNGKERNKQGSNVYITVSDTSREISTVLDEDEIPTRDKHVAKHTSTGGQKISGTSCLQYPQKLSKTRGNESTRDRIIRRDADSPRNQRRLAKNAKDRDSNTKSLNREPPFRVHQDSSDQFSSNKLAKLNPSDSDAGFRNQRNNDRELFKSAENEIISEATSYASDDFKNANSAGTTLRWKIIIKHHQPSASQTANESATDFSESSTLATLNDGFNRSTLMNTTNKESYDKITEREDGY